MIIDTSAIIAILLDEPDAPRMEAALATTSRRLISAGTMIELTAVVVRAYPQLKATQPTAIERALRLQVMPVTITQVRIAQDAYQTFGRGVQHRAKLNFGDCFSYALAKETGEPLLFKGNDFTHTDIEPALPPS